MCRLSDTAAQYESKVRNTENMPLVFKFGTTLVHLLFFKLRIHLSHDMRGSTHIISISCYTTKVVYNGDLVRKTWMVSGFEPVTY